MEDYLALSRDVFESRGFQVEVTETLRPNSINIVIDEFTNYIENRKIKTFCKSSPNNRCVYILTEFVEKRFGVESFNNFGGIYEAARIALINIRLRMTRDDFDPPRLKDFVALLLLSPVLVAYCLTAFIKHIASKLNRRKSNHRKQHRLVYFHMRYLGLKSHLQYAYAVISSHELILQGYDGKNLNVLGVLYPEFNKHTVLDLLMTKNRPFIEVTGSVTPYRQHWIARVNRYVRVLGLSGILGPCAALPFSSETSNKWPPIERAAYSLHPPQTRNWKYCSPMRLYRALTVDHNFPILTKHFHQHPIEDVCLLIENRGSVGDIVEMFFDRAALLNCIGPRIDTYNEIVKQRNDDLVQSLRGL